MNIRYGLRNKSSDTNNFTLFSHCSVTARLRWEAYKSETNETPDKFIAEVNVATFRRRF